MTERLIETLDRLGIEAGIETMTPEIRRFALLVRQDTTKQWPAREWVGLTDGERLEIVEANTTDDHGYDIWCDGDDVARAIEAKLKEKNT